MSSFNHQYGSGRIAPATAGKGYVLVVGTNFDLAQVPKNDPRLVRLKADAEKFADDHEIGNCSGLSPQAAA